MNNDMVLWLGSGIFMAIVLGFVNILVLYHVETVVDQIARQQAEKCEPHKGE